MKRGEVGEGVVDRGEFFVCDESDADLVGGGRGDVGLAVIAPIDFDEVGPRSNGEVLAETDTHGVNGGFGEAGPGSDAGVVAVGADEVAGAESLAIGADEMTGGSGLDALDGVLPVEADAESDSSVE